MSLPKRQSHVQRQQPSPPGPVGNWELVGWPSGRVGWELTFLKVLPDQPALQRDQLADARIRQIEQAVQGFAAEREGFGGPLELDVKPRTGLDDVHVDVGF